MRTEAEIEEEKLNRKIKKTVWNAINEYNMIEDGDKLMICLSGGKDSYTMLDIMMQIQKASVFNFEIVAVNLDQKQPGFPEEVLPNYLTNVGVEYKIIEEDTYSIVKEKTPVGKTTCSLCSRLRRGNLYTAAQNLGCNKLMLGHHRDDIIETFFLNLFFAGKIETMPPKYETNDGRFVVLRPLAYVKEKDIIRLSEIRNYPIIPCNLCGSQPNMQRQLTKAMLAKWEETYPGRNEIMFTAMKNISPTHMLDHDLFDFKTLTPKLMGEVKAGKEFELL
ncbi:tRNA 2-thiocytidine(32) synthetase TtcA [Putridiphycobacter roseus]|uniref:tRNA-cytidine(32) 2-sulfurtransferase n=1 Tax=Putridiphycobacter roseus TaxID=2219161 RepID=A0A2W1MVY8_9FLAO|nr:tRNA 2-thiocytidine(32) synthetase TtcA [Putridiphycobacter roseus]PZE16269.1 tRNA 2-thiocytidine(32) synthetase TtcA [Putridiphycobacter roseus]